MLDRMNELKIRHIDYEKIFDDQGRPLVAFPFAGIAGVINILSELGRHLLKQGISNPFLYISPPYQYANVEHAYSSLKAVGQLIVNAGISKKINLPFIVGVIGSTGNCGKGALEALT
jgi:alpha-aminoadipic semialdehyde synthase